MLRGGGVKEESGNPLKAKRKRDTVRESKRRSEGKQRLPRDDPAADYPWRAGAPPSKFAPAPCNLFCVQR